jgi:alpha-tubulin suppressor-like RCC1 family protein
MNNDGQLGSAPYDYDPHPTPQAVSGIPSVAKVTAGRNFACAWPAGGSSALCWGLNNYGQLGNGAGGGPTGAVTVTNPGGGAPIAWAQLVGYSSSTCGLSTAGAAYCWGNPDYVGVSNPKPGNALVPLPVAAGLTWTSLSTGCQATTTLAIATNSALYGWGARPRPRLLVSALRPHAAAPRPSRRLCQIVRDGQQRQSDRGLVLRLHARARRRPVRGRLHRRRLRGPVQGVQPDDRGLRHEHAGRDLVRRQWRRVFEWSLCFRKLALGLFILIPKNPKNPKP